MSTITIPTSRTMELIDITEKISAEIVKRSFSDGFCFLFNPHTTAALTINEGADPDVQTDIIAGLQKMVPMHYPFKHAEGNSPAHIMASLIGPSVQIAVENGRPVLGTWQKIFFCEFDGPRTRTITIHYLYHR
ncbi:MAG: hypothetical protein CSA26_04225 [Desulfobacterales bacterium]|nr:MAG: hypothetical protein CSA26_04225 [Desulfobacterales bacterium]